MGAIDNWMRKHGYAKLDRYGLVLTPDDRVLSTRPAVLDDGLGGKIVGWVDGDLAAMELDKWRPADMPKAAKAIAMTAKPAAPAPVAQRPLPGVAPSAQAPIAATPAPVAAPAPMMAAPAPMIATPADIPAPMPMSAAPASTPMPMPTLQMPAPKATPAPMRAVAPAIAAPAEVADLPPVEEDEWEWEIAMARARAAADQVAEVPAAMGFSKPTAPAPKPFSKAAPRTMPMASVAMPKPEPMPAWPKTEPYNDQWAAELTATEISPRVLSPLEKSIAADKTVTEKRTTVMSVAPAPSRSTVIPVPSLPVAARPGDVRPPSYARPMSPRTRMARGTGREDTVQTTIAPQAHADETSPYITLPSEVKPQSHAHTKRAAAKR